MTDGYEEMEITDTQNKSFLLILDASKDSTDNNEPNS
jgi:hypothetical protein